MHRSHTVAAVVVLLGGCSLTAPICTMEARPGITVEVRDDATGASALAGAIVVAREGAHADTADVFPPMTTAGLVHERAGTYLVTVEQEGYQPWSRGNVRVTRGECHVNTVALEARLVR